MFYIVKSNTYSISKKITDKIISSKNILKEDIHVFDFEEKGDFDRSFSEYLSLNFDGSTKAIILKNSTFINQAKIDKIIEDKIEKTINISTNNIIIFQVDKLNKTGKINKKYNDKFEILSKDAPSANEINSFIKNFFESKGIKITNLVINNIKDNIGENFDLLVSELNKLLLIVDKEVTNEIVDKSVIDFSRQRLYKITEYVLKQDINNIHNILNQLKTEGEGIYLISDALVREISKFLRYCILKQKNYSNDEIAKFTNWNKWGIKNYESYLKYWKNIENLSYFFYEIILKNCFMEMLENTPEKPLDILEYYLITNIKKIQLEQNGNN